ncbi:MAG: hypothetical protein H6765_00395 [Candidatus Peribacteria bacterium]|nr:MAG: hypothetical protein H6765_00395 [Candidatus Peribacteria bacterium]
MIQLNDDYATMRNKDAMLRTPQVRLVPPGTFLNWLASNQRL